MKKFRPYCAGFIVLYALCALCIGDSVYSLVSQARGTANEYMSSFSLFSYLIAAMAIVYVRLYAQSKVVVGEKTMLVANPVYIKPQAGEKRAMFLFRQGETDIKLMNKTFNLADLAKYGYIEDLNYSRLDASGVGEKNKLFPVHEIALVMQDGKRYHMNGGYYTAKQLKAMFQKVQTVTGIAPTGKLADLLK